ncbi:MAG: TIGR04149 family rSAM-modified RiPP [Sedimentibacter sp.]|nr:TIGR04149 family rSAM-modified RiPP [Sedimentibacter sp.]
MKKLAKLRITSDNIINDKELKALKGGDGPCCVCKNVYNEVMGYMAAYDAMSCDLYCNDLTWFGYWGWTYC